MDEAPRRRATGVRGNVTPGGRYGTADERMRHVEPEIPPVGIEGADVRLPEGLPGALPENDGRREAEERSVVRMPEATVEALEGDESR